MQGFAGVDIAHTDDQPLIHDRRFHLLEAALEQACQTRAVELVGQGFDTETDQPRMGRQLGSGPKIEHPETPWIDETQHAAVIEVESQVLMRPRRLTIQKQPARHSQMEEYGGATVEMNQNIFGPPPEAADTAPLEALCEVFRQREAEVAPTLFDLLEDAPGKSRPQGTHGRLDLG